MTFAIDARVTKRYGAREVLHDATLAVKPATVHALVGENGAGKSTLVKVIAGVVRAELGTLTIAGTQVALPTWNRKQARAAGIGIVQQHGASAPSLTVVENAVLGVEGGPLLSLDGVAAKLRALGDKIGLAVDPYARVEDLGLGAAQRAEIVTALYHGATTLILDEPTAVLAPVEVKGLLATLQGLAAEGKTVVIVTHKLDEVKSVASDVTVLREGATVAQTSDVSTAGGELDIGAIARAMVGEDVPPPVALEPPPATAPNVLVLDMVSVGRELAEVSLTVRRGEIVGVAGVDGNGQRELVLAIAGLARSRGRVRIGERDAAGDSPARRLAAGLAHVPEDRHHGGLILDATVAENLALNRKDITGRFRIDRDAVRRNAVKRIAELDIRPADSDAIVRELSGGNQQKVVVGRELSRPNLRVVVAAHPTRGVDLGAVAKIHDRLRASAKAGSGVLVVSADLDELLALCHRIAVLLRGRIVGELAGDELRAAGAREQLGMLMTGGVREGAA